MPVARADAMQGQTVRLRVTMRMGGDFFDPSEVRQVQILDGNDAVTDTIPAGSIVRTGVGLYYVDWAIPAAEPATSHHDRWYLTSTVGAVEQHSTRNFYVQTLSVLAAGAPYMTNDELASYLTDATELNATQISALGERAQEIVETICEQKFLPYEQARVFSGKGKRVQPLDLQVIRGSVSMIEFLYDSGWTDVTPADLTQIRVMDSRKMIGLGNVRSRSQLLRAAASELSDPPWLRSSWVGGGCGTFPIGIRNVRITAQWGRWTRVPLQIKDAMGRLLSYAGRCNDPNGNMANPYVSESIPNDRTFVLDEIVTAAKAKKSTGFPDIDRTLYRFRRVPAVVSVI